MSEQPNGNGWLVERSGGGTPLYLMVCGSDKETPEKCRGSFDWTVSANDALRFARRQDAVLFVGAMRTLSAKIVHESTLRNLRIGDDASKVTEHVWTGY